MQIEDVVKISSKGQIVIPKSVRKRVQLEAGDRLLLAVSDGDQILLKKLRDTSLEEISSKAGRVVAAEKINVDNLVEEAISWARKTRKKQSA